MRNAIIRNKKTGKEGHIFHFNDRVIDPKKEYLARFKDNPTSTYKINRYKGSELELIRTNREYKDQLTIF